MFKALFFVCIVLSAQPEQQQCFQVHDNGGPYTTSEICFEKIDKMAKEVLPYLTMVYGNVYGQGDCVLTEEIDI
jgi:nucleoside-diphosphate-sugar epimerase